MISNEEQGITLYLEIFGPVFLPDEMGEASNSSTETQLSCSICLELLKDPVTIPCGHSYCMDCIRNCWKEKRNSSNYKCPQCRQSFSPRPALNKNVVMAEMVENLNKRELEMAQNFAGPGDMECDVCKEKKLKAVKACLVCLQSYCQAHLEGHEEFHSGKHKTIEAPERLKEMICPKHEKPLDIFCRTDQLCICYVCTVDEHKSHDTVAAEAECTETQKQLEDIQRKSQQQIQECVMRIQGLKETLKNKKETAARTQTKGLLKQLEKETDDLKMKSTELEKLSPSDHIHFLQVFRSLVSKMESSDQLVKEITLLCPDDLETSVSEKLDKEDEKKTSERSEEPRSKHPPIPPPKPTQLQHLPSTLPKPFRLNLPPPLPAPLQYISTSSPTIFQSPKLTSPPPLPPPLHSITPSRLPPPLGVTSELQPQTEWKPQLLDEHYSWPCHATAESADWGYQYYGLDSDVTDEDVRKSVSRLKEKVEQFCKEVMEGDEAPDFIPLSLDRNTVNKCLCLSEGDTVATYTDTQQLYPDHPERFQNCSEVLSRERVCGRCYWELELSSSNSLLGVGIAVSYKSIRRKGTREECGFGFNDQSWKLYCTKSRFFFRHNNKRTDLPEDLISSRIGVYVDERAGILSFFRISDTMILIHREQITFTQPLFAGFWLDSGSRIKICCS
ncbi:hypothetical protein DNTS_031521 [Danionella cerebrum]|uniref:RING-type E3 ubiquitin transferase n=1 Tax=Danionella cerebrum TaxID=2873325 RepID=A0A553Q8M8_9TELE|nr:hypothetical protein DNTS_031521 [Danionella translucida]